MSHYFLVVNFHYFTIFTVLSWPSLVVRPSHERAGSDPSSITGLKSQTTALQSLAYESSDSDADRPDPDVVLDDLANRRFHSPSPVAPTNFALPMSPLEAAAVSCTYRPQVAVSNVPRQSLTHLRSETGFIDTHPFAILSVLTLGLLQKPSKFGFELLWCHYFAWFSTHSVDFLKQHFVFNVWVFLWFSVLVNHGWFDVHWSLVVCNKNGCLLSSSQSQPRQRTYRRPVSADAYIYDDSEEEDDEFGYADPVQDDLYARKVGLMPQTSATEPFDKFLPKFWTPEEDAHVKMIKLGSQRRPWYRKIQGFRSVQYWGKKEKKNNIS